MNCEDDKEMQRMWQESTFPGGLDAAELARRIEGFDKKIWWRNAREYFAGGALMVYFTWMMFNPKMRFLAAAGMVAIVFVMAYMWRSQRATPKLDAGADARAYRTALLNRYDQQIALLKTVKYWYVLPMWGWMILVVFSVPANKVMMKAALVVGFTVLSGFVVWLNESVGVKRLRAKRDEVVRLMGD